MLIMGIVLCVQTSFAQNFSIRTNDAVTSLMQNVMVIGDEYLTVGTGFDTLSGEIIRPLFVRHYDSYGNLIEIKEYLSNDWIITSINDTNGQLNDSVLVVMGEKYLNTTEEIFGCLIWLNLEGDTLQTRTYSSPYFSENSEDANWHRPTALTVSDDGQYIYYAAQVIAPPSENNFIIRKLSAEGNVEWTYVNELNEGYLCFAIDYFDGQIWFHRRNSGVNELISLNDENGAIDVLQIVETQNLELYRTDDIVIDETGITCASIEPGDPGQERPAVFKMNFDGSYQWSRIPDDAQFGAFQDNEHIVKTNDNGYVSCSIKYDEIPNPEFPWDPAANNTEERIWLWKVDLNGNFLWQRFYEYLTFDSGYYYLENVAHDMKATPDGGFIMAGEATAGCIDPPDCVNFSQQGWLLKVDGCGCLVPGCDEECTVGVNENYVEKRSYFTFGPNPVRDYIHVYLPARTPDPKGGQRTLDLQHASLNVYDINGNHIKTFNLKHDETTYIIDTTSLAIGEYMLSLMDGNEVLQTERIIVTE